jgi:putative PIG3 family NAD(P)H quinone oxidoreductase
MQMKAIQLHEFGGAEHLYVGKADVPQADAGQVSIEVAATSVNRPDIIQRQGNYPPPPGDSEILGLEVAGTISAVGEGVTQWEKGDRVFALVGGGGYAEYVTAHAGHVMRIPDNLNVEQAACICETYIAAWLNAIQLAHAADGDTFLLHGGGGGVNTAAIQLCKAMFPASKVLVTASGGKLDRVRELGADVVIDYREDKFAAVVKSETDGKGADIILDHIGGAYLADNMKSLAVGGRLVVIGIMGGASAELNLALMMVKRQSIIGSVLRSRPIAEKSRIIAEFESTVMPLFANGTIAPLVSDVLPLEQVAEAHRMMEAGKHFGKIVLTIN